MKPVNNTVSIRYPSRGDKIKLVTWTRFFVVATVRGGLIYFVGHPNLSYKPELDWIFE